MSMCGVKVALCLPRRRVATIEARRPSTTPLASITTHFLSMSAGVAVKVSSLPSLSCRLSRSGASTPARRAVKRRKAPFSASGRSVRILVSRYPRIAGSDFQVHRRLGEDRREPAQRVRVDVRVHRAVERDADVVRRPTVGQREEVRGLDEDAPRLGRRREGGGPPAPAASAPRRAAPRRGSRTPGLRALRGACATAARLAARTRSLISRAAPERKRSSTVCLVTGRGSPKAWCWSASRASRPLPSGAIR